VEEKIAQADEDTTKMTGSSSDDAVTLQILLQCSCNACLTKESISVRQSQTNAKHFVLAIVVLK
jgi:hypothetical protein